MRDEFLPSNSTVVLVHGAWADGPCWKDVVLPLERQGLKVICAPIPLTSLSEDISALTRALERTSGPIVLAGHAYGGAVIGAIRDERVKSFVYIAALAPDEGETVAQVFYREQPHPEAPKLAPDKHGFIWMPEEGFAREVAQKTSTDQTKIMAAVQRPRNSGDSEPQMHISKEGDEYLRTLLVQGAHYILGPFGEDSDLRRWGREALGARREKRQETSGGGGSTEAGGTAASAVGKWRSVRTVA